MANGENATLGRKAGSGLHSVKTTVEASVASILAMLPVYGGAVEGSGGAVHGRVFG